MMVAMNESWAKSLHHPHPKKEEKEQCGWSDEYDVIVHRFDLNATVCRCGAMEVSKQEYSGGWRRQKVDPESK
jgi:hypothetical protein